MRKMLEASIRDVVVEAERFAESGGGDIVALVRVRGKGRASGIAIDREQAHLSSFDGRGSDGGERWTGLAWWMFSKCSQTIGGGRVGDMRAVGPNEMAGEEGRQDAIRGRG